jgi:hypothetical protein
MIFVRLQILAIVLIILFNEEQMSPIKLTKSFFQSQRKKYCPQCSTKYRNYLMRDIVIYANSSFDEEYFLLLEWHYDDNTHTFLVDEKHGNRSPEDNLILNKSHSISSIEDLQNICASLNKLGYQIAETRLLLECSSKYTWTEPCFKHIIDLAWFGDTKTFLIQDEYIKFPDYSMSYVYTKDTCSITDRTGTKQQHYSIDYIPNIDLKKYSSLKKKIKQILLLG